MNTIPACISQSSLLLAFLVSFSANANELEDAQNQQSPGNFVSPANYEINLNPGGFFSGSGGNTVKTDSGSLGTQGTYADYTVLGGVGSGTSPTAYASVELQLTEQGKAGYRFADASAELTYYVQIEGTRVTGQPLATVPTVLTYSAFRNADALGNSWLDSPNRGIGNLHIQNLSTGSNLLDYSTENDPDVATSLADSYQSKVYYDDEIRVGDLIEVKLSAYAYGWVSCCGNIVASSYSEVFVDPYFLFDQAAYDAKRVLDPSLPDIQLAEYFTFSISPSIYQEVTPVPLPATWLMLSAALGLLPLSRLKKRS